MVQCHREPAERVGSAVEEAAMSATVIPVLTYDKLYPLGDLFERRERSYGSRTPLLYSLSCVNRRPSVRTGRSPPEEEQSFHSVARMLPVVAHNTRPPRGKLVEKHPVTDQRHRLYTVS